MIVEFCFVYSLKLRDLKYLEKTNLEFVNTFSSFLINSGFEQRESYALDPGKEVLKKEIFMNDQDSDIEEIHISRIYPSILYSCKKKYDYIPSLGDFRNDKTKYEKKFREYILNYFRELVNSFGRRDIRNMKRNKPYSYKPQRDYFLFYVATSEKYTYSELFGFLEKGFTPHSLHTFEAYKLHIGVSDIFSVVQLKTRKEIEPVEALIPLHIKNCIFLRSTLDNLIGYISEYTDVTLGRNSEKKILEICRLFDSILNPISLYVRKMPQNHHYEEIFDICGILDGFDYIMNNIKVFTNLHLQKRIKRLTLVIIVLTVLMVILIMIQIFGTEAII